MFLHRLLVTKNITLSHLLTKILLKKDGVDLISLWLIQV